MRNAEDGAMESAFMKTAVRVHRENAFKLDDLHWWANVYLYHYRRTVSDNERDIWEEDDGGE